MFERGDRALNSGTPGIQGIPFRRAAQDAGIKAEVRIGISVNAAAVLGRGAGIFAGAAQGAAGSGRDRDGLRTNKFKAFGAIFATANALKIQPGAVAGAEWEAGFIPKDLIPVSGIAGVQRDNGFGKLKFAQECGVCVIGVKSGVTKESCVVQSRMPVFEIPENREQRAGVSEFLV